MKSSMFGVLGAVIIAIGFSGCTSKQPMRTSLTEMGAISKTEYGANGLRLVSAINVTGLGAEDVVGTISYNPDGDYVNWFVKLFYTQDFTDTISPRLTNGASLIVERSVENNISSADIVKIRDDITKYQQNVAKLANLKLKEGILKKSESIIKSKDGKADKLFNSLIENNILLKEKSLSQSVDVQTELASTQRAIKEATNTINDINLSIQKSGVIIADWERDTELSASADLLDSTAGGSAGKSKTIKGFVIIGDPKIITLYLGNQDVNNSKSWFANESMLFDENRIFVTYYQLRAKHIAYTESIQSSVAAAIKADISKFTGALKSDLALDELLKEINLSIASAYGNIMSSSSSGLLESKAVKVRGFNFSNNYSENIQTELNLTKNSFPIISSRATLGVLLNKK